MTGRGVLALNPGTRALLWFVGTALGAEICFATAAGRTDTVRFDPGPTPIPVVLSLVDRDITSLSLRWTESLDPRLSAYELWRWSPRVMGTDGSRIALPLATIGLVLLISARPRVKQRYSRVTAAGLVAALSCAGLTLLKPAVAGQAAPPVEGALLVYQGTERDDVSHVDTALNENWPYRYQVRVLTTDGLGSLSNLIEAQTLPPPTPTATNTPTVTATPIKTATPCPTYPKSFNAFDVGRGIPPWRDLLVDKDVVSAPAPTLTVSGSLCWFGECGFDTVGPGGVPPSSGCDLGDCDNDPYPGRNHAALFYMLDGHVTFATKQSPGSMEEFEVTGLDRGDVIRVSVNDGDPANNTLGFTAKLTYHYRSCTPGG